MHLNEAGVHTLQNSAAKAQVHCVGPRSIQERHSSACARLPAVRGWEVKASADSRRCLQENSCLLPPMPFHLIILLMAVKWADGTSLAT